MNLRTPVRRRCGAALAIALPILAAVVALAGAASQPADPGRARAGSKKAKRGENLTPDEEAIMSQARAERGKGRNPASRPAKAKADEQAPARDRQRLPASEEKRSDGRPNGAELMAWVEPDKTEPPGTTYKTFHSKTIDGDASYLIYLPPDYEKEKTKRYPVLYWLHGSGAPQNKGGGIVQRFDQAIRDGKAPPMIIVLVNGLRGATMYSDTKDGKWPLETVIVNDLIPHVDQTYRTCGTREMRAVEGFSMGGFGAAHFGFKYPDVFGVVSILAPALLGPDLTDDSLKRKWQEHLSFVFSGDLDAFHANNPFDLIPKNADRIRGRSIIRIVPHDGEGSKWLIPRCEQLHALLDKYNVANELDVRADVMHHNFGLLYDSMGERGVGFYAKAFANSPRTGR